MGKVYDDGSFVLDQPHEIEAFRLLSLRGRLQVEVRTGMTWRQPSGPIVREVIGSKTRNKAKLLAEYEAWLIEKGILKDRGGVISCN